MRRARLVPPALLGVVGALVMAGCGTTAELEADRAVGHYDQLVRDLGMSLAPHGLTWDHAPRTRKVQARDGGCEYDPGNYVATSPPEELLDPEAWGPYLDAMAPVLDRYGFAAVDAPRRDGALLRVVTEDRYGTELSVDMTGDLRLWGARLDAPDCDPGSLGL